MARDLWTHDEMILVTYIKKMKISSLISISKLGLDNPFPFATSQFTLFPSHPLTSRVFIGIA